MSDKDPFKDLVFNGAPSEYRLFRRKILLSVASLEEKHVYLAGPRILNRLTGEAWRATEHLAIGDLRSEKGWLRVLQALDEHYRYLPETELNECVDEFLFHLKRKGHEGPTAFVSRFKAVLSRLETLVAAEKAQQKGSTKRRRSSKRTPSPDGEPSTSSLSSDHAEDEEPVLTKDRVEAAAAAAETPSGARAPAEPASVSKGPRTVGSFVESPKKKPPSAGGSQKSRGTQKADDERANRQMMEDLGKLEVGHLRVKPIFPEVILGHLFMRKYGLNREQRSQVIRSTGGSCRFRDVEKVIRASDYEDKFHDPSSRVQSSRSTSGANVLAAEEGSSLSEPTYSDEDEVNEAATGDEENDDDEDLEEAYEIQKKAKNDAKRAFRSYKDSRRRVKEIRKDRQPYMPVVAIPPSSSNAVPPDALPVQPTFRYDRKPSRRTNDKGKGGRKGRKEDVSLVQASLVTEFSYMVSAEDAAPEDDQEIFAVSVPPGLAVIDTGCTTSVIGRRTADRYIEFFKARNIPEPTLVTLPPVQLKGFNGMRSSSDRGLKWTVKLGSLWGQVTTYLVEGEAPFLLSRKVLQSMEATIDLGKCTLSSEKHGLKNEPLAQASNGHLLMPLVPTEDYEDLLQVQLAETPVDKAAGVDKRKHFQTIMKHTRYTQVDTGTYRYELRMVFGQDVDFALCAYRRAVFDRPGACLFAYRYATAQEQAVFAGPASLSHHCERGRGLASIRLGVSFGQDFNKAKVSLAKGGEAARSVLARRKKVVSALQSCHCPGHQSHAHVSEKPRDHGGRYPPKFCKKLVRALASRDKEVLPEHDIFMQTDDEADSERESDQEGDPDEEPRLQAANRRSYAAMIQKLHVNTGHASVPQMLRLAQRAKAPADLIAEIRKFKRSVCEELQVPPTHRVAALRHTETPNHIVGLDLVQVELKKEGPRGPIETKYNVLTAVDYASDFAQQIVLPAGPGVVAKAFHAMWCRPYGPPRVVYVDPDQRWVSGEFQEYLRSNSITLLDSATESHWQLGRVEIAQRILRNMALRVWRTTDRPAEEVIENCCGVRNEQLKHLTEQQNLAVQDAVLSERDFAQKMLVRQQAAEAFIEAKVCTSSADKGVVSLPRGTDSPIPRVIWVVVNGFMYQCSPECLRPVTEDEVAFKQLAQQYHTGHLPEELEQATPSRRGPAGRFFDLTADPPTADDFMTPPASDEEGEPSPGASPRAAASVRFREEAEPSETGVERPAEKAPRLDDPDDHLSDYEPSPADVADSAMAAPPGTPEGACPEPPDGDDALCCEIALDVFDVDLDSKGQGLWTALEECATVAARPGQKRRVEDRERFRGAMKKEWQSWLENRVTSIAKSKGARLVLVGFQDPDLGDKSDRQLYFRPPPEVRELMNLSEDDVLRLEKAAYGLAEAPRAWFLRLSRELVAVGLIVSQLDPCVFCLRCSSTSDLLGICGVHVDDLLGGGTSVMDQCLEKLKLKLPFGDFRRKTIKYTGAEIRQHPDHTIEVTQEAYVDKLEEVSTKPFGKASDPLNEPTLMRACCGQLAWVANHSRPDQAFLASYLQGVQDKALVSHLELYNKSVREMKARRISLRFPPVPLERWSACSSALAMEKRLAIDYAIARACLQERHVLPFWTNNLQMISDCLTKLRGNKDILYRVLDTCTFHVRPSKESGRKEAARTKVQP
ncbi:RE1 [Symbiodinium necroappetens]|uniref:RE1 protein n=1 Tax=Symbiodinium necroappetens TaxID=1628268 RepID=A0A812U1Z8_9DINO|nr:RE1 [Symbiodinium necroappetens]